MGGLIGAYKYPEYLLFIESFEFRKRIFDYYLQSNSLIDKLEAYQRRVYAIQNSYNDTLKQVKDKNPNLTEQEITQQVSTLTKIETTELEWLKTDTLEQLNNLDSLKIEAQLISDKLTTK